MKHFFESRTGVAGIILLAILVFAGIFGPILVPFRDAGRHWRDISYWQDSPAAVPPIWAAATGQTGRKIVPARLEGKNPSIETLDGGGGKLTWRFDLSYPGMDSGVDATLILPGDGRIPVVISMVMDGGSEIQLARQLVEASPGDPARIAVSLPGRGILTVAVYALPGTSPPGAPSFSLPGNVSGLMGTDVSKRDVFTGIVLGIRWALILGMAVSFLTVLTGILLGIAAACFGGWVDTILSRVYEFFSLMPMLPFLIVLSAAYRPSLWMFTTLALLFFWTRSFKPIYAMALHIREEGYIEAGKSMGTTRFYRIFKYVLPALLPYGFAIMALSVPGIILYEAGISLLGLGDASVVTWGQMLHDALIQGAVINRLWWCIIPPGIMIALTGITFALIGRGLDKVWKPRPRG